MRRSILAALSFLAIIPLLIATVTVGGGATPAIQGSFTTAFGRGGFSQLVVLPPLANVQPLGSQGGLVQEFTSLANGTLKFALVDSNPNGANQTWQVYSDIYTYYSSNGVQTAAGYPTDNTTACPSNTFGKCDYQFFSNDYAVFAYSSPGVVTFAVADPFYTEWNNNGGIGGVLGIATGAAIAVISVANTAGTEQTFLNGAVFSYPASSSTPSTYNVSGAIYTAFAGVGGYAALGFPTTEATLLASGVWQQSFESGRIQWTSGANPASPATVIFPIGQIEIAGASGALNLEAVGASATLSAVVFDTHSNVVTGRTLAWSTSNGNVVSVQGNARN